MQSGELGGALLRFFVSREIVKLTARVKGFYKHTLLHNVHRAQGLTQSPVH